MKRLLVLGTIAAVTLTTTGQAQSLDEQRRVVRRVAPKHSVKTERATVTRPSTNRTVVRRSINGGSPNYYSGYYPYYYGGGPSVSIGIGGGYGYPGYYGYGYGYPYGYGYNTYPSYYYGQYPTAYATTTRYATSRYGDLAYDDNLVIAVQRRLARAGYYHGPIDGIAGRATRSAIARWEADHGMYADGRIDHRTLRALGIS